MLQPGDQFGRLTLQTLIPSPPKQWWCQCTCGATVTIQQGHLRAGHTRSCGCLQRELRAQRKPWQRSPEYQAWQKLRRKYCVCTRWQHSYPAFFADLGTRPSPRHVLLCAAKHGMAGPKTVRWLPKSETPRRAVIKPLRIGREEYTVRVWAKRVDISHTTIYKRLAQVGRPERPFLRRPRQESPLC